MSLRDTTYDTLTDRLIGAATDAILDDETMVDDSPGSWVRPVVLGIQELLAAELIALEHLAGEPLSLQNAVAFILQGVEA
jgi:hypothetical protein